MQEFALAALRARAPHFRECVQAGIDFTDFEARLRCGSGYGIADGGPAHADATLPRASGKKRDYGLDLIARELAEKRGQKIDLD